MNSGLALSQSSKVELNDVSQNAFISKDEKGDLWVSSLKSWTVFNGIDTKIYSSEDATLGIDGSFIQSELFLLGKWYWFTTYESLIRYDPELNQFSSIQVVDENGELYKTGYHLFSVDTVLNELWMSIEGNIVSASVSGLPLCRNWGKSEARRFAVVEVDSDSIVIVGCPWIVRPGIEIIRIGRNNNSFSSKRYFEEFIFSKDTLRPYFIKSVLFDNAIFAISNEGVIKFDLSEKDNFELLFPGIPFSDAVSINIDNLLLSATDSSLFTLSVRNGEFWEYSDFAQDGKSPSYLHMVDEIIWLSYNGWGVDHVHKSKLLNHKFRVYSGSELHSLHKLKGDRYCVLTNDSLLIFDNLNSLKYSIALPDFDGELMKILSLGIADILLATTRNVFRLNLNNLKWYELNLKKGVTYSDVYNTESTLVITCENETLCYDIHSFSPIGSCNDIHKHVYFKNHIEMYYELISKLDLVDTHFYSMEKILSGDINQIRFSENFGKYIISSVDGAYIIGGNEIYEPFHIKRMNIGNRFVQGVYDLRDSSVLVVAKEGLFTYNLVDSMISVVGLDLNVFQNTYYNTSLQLDSFLYLLVEDEILAVDLMEDINRSYMTYKINVADWYLNDVIQKSNVSSTDELSFEQNSLSFRLVLNDYTDPKNSKILFRLDNEQNWNILDNGGVIKYNELAPGSYSLYLYGKSNTGSVERKKLTWTILPPYHQTWWFRTTSVLGLLGLGFGFNYLNTKRKLKAAQIKLDQQAALSAQREKIADDLHDELGTELSKILYLSDEATETKDLQKKEELVHDITNLAASSITNMRDMLWVLEQKNDTLESLLVKIRSSVQQTLKEYPISLKFERENINEAEAIQVSGEIRQQVLLIVKEAIHNVIKHAGASEVVVSSELINDGDNMHKLSVSIQDNGVGSSALNEYASKGRGLASMRKRVNQINGTLLIESAEAKGTSVSVSVNIEVA